MTIPKFDNYVCPGDTVSWSFEGFDIVARIEFDHDTKPTDFDCYDDEQIQAWKNDDWFFGGVVLSVSRNGVDLSDRAASLWGIDCNAGENNDYLSEVCEELQGEAIESARCEQARIVGALTA